MTSNPKQKVSGGETSKMLLETSTLITESFFFKADTDPQTPNPDST